ncbi:UNVERIFIED_CONTAM: hypothetical protein NCL1_00979 [Trichonephila clavipes]
MLWRRHGGPERLRGRPWHHLRRHRDERLSGQRLEIRSRGHLRQHRDPAWHGFAGAGQHVIATAGALHGPGKATGRGVPSPGHPAALRRTRCRPPFPPPPDLASSRNILPPSVTPALHWGSSRRPAASDADRPAAGLCAVAAWGGPVHRRRRAAECRSSGPVACAGGSLSTRELFRTSGMVQPWHRLPERPAAPALYAGNPERRLRSYRRSADHARAADAAGKPLDLCDLRTIGDPRDSVSGRDRATHRLWSVAGCEQCLCLLHQSPDGPARLAGRFPAASGGRDSSGRPCRGGTALWSVADRRAWQSGGRSGLGAVC